MRGGHRFGIILGVLFAVPALAGDGNTANGENRCDDLGSACVCSETMSGSYTIPGGLTYNPPDSTSKQCNGGNALIFSGCGPPSNYVMATSVSDPAGSGGRAWRLENYSATCTGQAAPGTTYTGGSALLSATLCQRGYQYFSSDFPDTTESVPGGTRAKMMEIKEAADQPNHEAQLEWDSSGSWFSASYVIHNLDTNLSSDGSADGGFVKLTDVRGHWIRVEQCWDIDAAGHTRERARLAILGGITRTMIGPWDSHIGPVDVSLTWIGNYFRQNANQGFRYIKYNMQALWTGTTAANYWIGPASEVEGGSGGSTTTPPPTSVPAPTLFP